MPPQGDKPVTLGIGEPFTTTVTISFIFALILALPFVLYQAYAFLMPAFEPGQRRHILPLVLSIPFEVGVLLATLVERRAAARARRIEATLAGQPLQS